MCIVTVAPRGCRLVARVWAAGESERSKMMMCSSSFIVRGFGIWRFVVRCACVCSPAAVNETSWKQRKAAHQQRLRAWGIGGNKKRHTPKDLAPLRRKLATRATGVQGDKPVHCFTVVVYPKVGVPVYTRKRKEMARCWLKCPATWSCAIATSSTWCVPGAIRFCPGSRCRHIGWGFVVPRAKIPLLTQKWPFLSDFP